MRRNKMTKPVSAAMALDALEQAGLEMPSRPKREMPFLPEDVTVVSEQELMRLFRDHVVWREYVVTTLGTYENEASDAETYYKRVEATHLGTVGGGTVTEAKAAAMLLPEVMAAKDDLDVAKAKVEQTKRIYEGVVSRAEFLSRELTRRKEGSHLDNRDHKWGGG